MRKGECKKQNELEIHFSPKGDWTYHDEFWSSLLTLSSDKYRENDWLDSNICFRWYGNMRFVHLDFSLSMNPGSSLAMDREKINIKSFDEDNCRKLVSTIVIKVHSIFQKKHIALCERTLLGGSLSCGRYMAEYQQSCLMFFKS